MQTPPVRFGAGKSADEAQHQELGELMPPVLAADTPWPGEVQTAHIRVWADDQYRAQNLTWQHTFQEQLDYANTVLAADFGVRLVADYRSWPRHAPSATLEEDLVALKQQDGGDDVLVVIGLTSSLALVSATFEELGVASLPGRHLMLRGYAAVGEREAFERAFSKIPADERENAVEGRRRHKTTTVLLHELGHNFGAPHELEADTIMNGMYSLHAAAFSESARDIVRAALDARLHRRPLPGKEAAKTRHPTLVIDVTSAGTASVGGMGIDDATLAELMRQSFANDKDTEVVIRAAAGAPHAAAVHVLELARSAGLQHLSLSTP